jgi:hypothetical protein
MTSGLDHSLIVYNNGVHNILGYATKGVWDPKTCQALFVGAGHLETTKFIAYSAKQNAWSVAANPTWWCDDSVEQNPYTCFRHAYGFNTLDPATGRFFYLDFAMRPEVLAVTEPPSASWTPMPAFTQGAQNSPYSGMEYMPSRHSLIFFDYSNATLLELADGASSWASLGASYTSGPYHTYVVGNAADQSVLFGGGNGSLQFHLLRADGSVKDIAPPPRTFHPAPDMPSCCFSKLIGDPSSKRYLAFGNDGVVSTYDPATDAWTAPSPIPAESLGLPFPIPELGVTLMLTESARVFLYRAAP